MPEPPVWHVYTPLCRNGAYCGGPTNHLDRRTREHFNGRDGHYNEANSPARLEHENSLTTRADGE